MRLLLIISWMVSSGIGTPPLNKSVVRAYLRLTCLTYPDNKPTKMFPAIEGATRALFEWAILEEDVFVRLTEDIVRDERDRVLRERRVDIALRQQLEALRNEGLDDDEILIASAKRYWDTLQGLEEFNEES